MEVFLIVGIELPAPKPAMRCFGFFSFEQTKLYDFGVCSKTTRMLETLPPETPPAVLLQLEQSMNALSVSFLSLAYKLDFN